VSGRTVKFQGVLEEQDVRSWLLPFLTDIHREAIRRGMTEVVFDIRQLSYANAGLWRSMLVWLRRLERDDRGTYRLRLLSDPVYRWQKIGVPALQPFGKERLLVR
jgi:hypothetical protein